MSKTITHHKLQLLAAAGASVEGMPKLLLDAPAGEDEALLLLMSYLGLVSGGETHREHAFGCFSDKAEALH